MTDRLRSDVPPDTLNVTLDEGGVGVEYTDGREAYYHGVPERVEGSVRTMPEMHVHVLVTDESGREGVMVYVNDRTTHDDVLESTGVGRVLVEKDGLEALFPGVTVRMDGLAAVIDVDHDVVDGRVFVFEENELGERSMEIVPPEDDGGDGIEAPDAGPDERGDGEA